MEWGANVGVGHWTSDVDAVYGATEVLICAGFFPVPSNGSGGCWMFGLPILDESAGRQLIGHSLNVQESPKSPLIEVLMLSPLAVVLFLSYFLSL